jgi:hypothetical protein
MVLRADHNPVRVLKAVLNPVWAHRVALVAMKA